MQNNKYLREEIMPNNVTVNEKDTIAELIIDIQTCVKTTTHNKTKEEILALLEKLSEEYQGLRKVTEYMSGMIESLQKKVQELQEGVPEEQPTPQLQQTGTA